MRRFKVQIADDSGTTEASRPFPQLFEIVSENSVMANNQPEEKKTNEQIESRTSADDSVENAKTAKSRPGYRIPEFPKQKELTPEEKREKEKDRRRRQQARNFKTRIRNSLFGVAIIAVLAALVYFTIAKKDRPESPRVATPELATDFDVVLKSTDPAQIMNFSESLLNNLLRQSLPNQVTLLKQELELGQRLIDLDADEDSLKFGVNAKMDSLIFLDTLNLVYDLKDTSFRGQLIECAQEHLDAEDMTIRRKAHLGICLSLAHDYSRDPTDETYAKLFEQFKVSIPTLRDDLPSAVSLARLVTLASSSPRKDQVFELMNYAGTEFKKSSLEAVRSMGAKFHDDMFVGNFDFSGIAEQMLTGDEESLRQLARAVDAVTADSEISEIPISKVLSLAENLSQIGQDELRHEYVERLREASKNVTNEATAALIHQVFSDYDKRNSLTGQAFDLAANQYDGQPLEVDQLDGKIVVIAFFGLQHNVSREFLLRLVDYEYLITQGVDFVLDCVDENADPTALKSYAERRGIHVLTKSSSPGYFEQCPISKVPYLVILDRNHDVVAVNVNVDKLRSQLEQLVGTDK